MIALGIDCGFSCGYGVLGRGPALSGSRKLAGSSVYMGEAMRSMARITYELLGKHKPDVVAFASPFIGRLASPTQLRPIMSFPSLVEMICLELKIRCVEWDESAARKAFLGEGNLPRKSADIKRAVMAAVRQRGWPCCDDHSGDALVIAAYTLARLTEKSHETTPLFQAKAKRRK